MHYFLCEIDNSDWLLFFFLIALQKLFKSWIKSKYRVLHHYKIIFL